MIKLKPDQLIAALRQADQHLQQNNPHAALSFLRKALAAQPSIAEAHYMLGSAHMLLGQFKESATCTQRATKLNPQFRLGWFQLGDVYEKLGRLSDAIEAWEKANALGEDALTHLNIGRAKLSLQLPEAAEMAITESLRADNNNSSAFEELGACLHKQGRYADAISALERALELRADQMSLARVYANMGKSYFCARQLLTAVSYYQKALALQPDNAATLQDLGAACQELQRYEEAISCYEQALGLAPDSDYLIGALWSAKMMICRWDELDTTLPLIQEKILRGDRVSAPFPMLALTDDPAIQRKAAEIHAADRQSWQSGLDVITRHPRHPRIRIGYYSADFHNHATAYLMAELFELHDKGEFELTAFSFGPDLQDTMRQRISVVFDRFIDVRDVSDKEIALLSRNLEIDIAVDLKGYTKDCRPGIFAHRAAPIQVNYLGYPGTMGSPHIDYIIADKVVIPAGGEQFFSEKVVYLPNSYQVNDQKRLIANRSFTREELGLPATGFVFCCFNSNYKITPAIFDCWMRILKRVDGSLLWLFEENPSAAAHLRKEAQRRSVDPDRLVFAKRLPLPEHLARHRAAGLFLDALPYNAHTTASDALWAGLPVLTQTGEAFASRVAASLLTAMGLSELITSTCEAYESLAVELATDPEQLARLRQKLERNRLSTPLFDTPLFTKHIEAAYQIMYERHQATLPPDHICVAT